MRCTRCDSSSPFPLPPLPEQAAIVRFLDHADRRIRRYIRAKQKLIKLLEEQKQAIIHRAVTRGLDPNVRLKPSGVEWLGDVPEHWEVQRVKQRSLSEFDEFTTRPRTTSLCGCAYPSRQQRRADGDRESTPSNVQDERLREIDVGDDMLATWRRA